ncbi:uncharacterized protein B0H64DRAFT_459150 [Chaetomium fimeti]|uniref:Nephrocystin 3-like N-terminal domain-containing protein n=1 Tax=Chaetomium fimeti TaxID=1854472 RepID=A0AAE0LSJ2_9PEZI|nr:hypothetical protein B0H64DRAFT_459150 [Chaetomium fimeti]
MEALALASTFATLLGFSLQLYTNCKYYIDAARGDCPNDLKLILIETGSLEATLKSVELILSLSDNKKEDEERLKRQIGKTLLDIKSCMEDLLKLVPKPMLKEGDSKATKREKAKLLLNAVAWGTSGKKGTCDILLKHLRAHKATLSLGLTAELSHDVKKIGHDVSEVKSSINTMQVRLDSHQRAEIYEWLEQVNPSKNHNNAGRAHEADTGKWLTRSAEWKAFIDLSPAPKAGFFWLHGIPGAGKTVMAYTMIQQVRARAKLDKAVGYAYYYCFHGRNKDEAVPFLTWIICQLCREKDFIPVTLNELFHDGCEPSIPDLLDCLEAVLTQFQAAYIVIDAIDESSPRKDLLSILCTLGGDPRFAKIRLAATSREYEDVERAFKSRATSVSMNNKGVEEDIQKFVHSALKDPQYDGWGRKLREKVAAMVPVRAQGMFRFAACQLEYLAECGSASDVERELVNLPPTLNGTYERILRRIEPSHRAFAIRAMAIIMASMEQIGPIYGPTLVTTVLGGPGINSFYNIDLMRRHCVCLIKVHPDRTVNLAHYTVREFLQSSYVAKSHSLRDFSLPARKVNQVYFNTLMAVATQFSGLPNIQNIPEDPNGDPIDFRLYALRRTRMGMFWNRGELAAPAENKKLLMTLLDPYQPCYAGLQISGSDGHWDGSNPAMFEWLPKFNPGADAMERDAAYLTMLIGFNQPDLVKEFLRGKSDRDQLALFNTKMSVTFPVEWETFRKHGTYDRKPKPVTVMEFYNEGHDRGFETDDEMNILRGALGAYLPAGKGPAAAAKKSSTTTAGRKSSLGSQTSSPSANKPSSGRSTPTGGARITVTRDNGPSSTGGPSRLGEARSPNSSAPKSPRAAKPSNTTTTASSSRDTAASHTTGATRLAPPTRLAGSSTTTGSSSHQSSHTSSTSASRNSQPPPPTAPPLGRSGKQTSTQRASISGPAGGDCYLEWVYCFCLDLFIRR